MSAIAMESLRVPGSIAGVSDKFACVLRNVYTRDECKQLIDQTEKVGYEQAKKGDQSGRSNYRCIIDDAAVANELFRRIHTWLPPTWEYEDTYATPRTIRTDTVHACNERLRFQRYDPGQAFARHLDGAYELEDGSQRTHITVQLYLNDDIDGGATRFLDPSHYRGDNACDAPLDVRPEVGMVLMFEHELLHSGEPVIHGRKYTLRTDVLYKRGEPRELKC